MRLLTFLGILLITCTSSLSGQINRVIQCDVEGITFKAEMLDYSHAISRDTSLYYHIGDTIKVKYTVTNNNDKSIYIFDPMQLYWDSSREPDWDSCFCRYIYEHLGGSWFFNPGYNPGLMLIKLESSRKYQYTFEFILLGDKYLDHCKLGINKSRDWQNTKTNLILFDIGYVFESDSIKFTKEDAEGYINFTDLRKGVYFDAHLRRFYLGPLMFSIRK